MRARRSRSLCSASIPGVLCAYRCRREKSVAALVEKVQAVYVQADILVNNATIIPLVSVVDMDVAQWDRVMAVNTAGHLFSPAVASCRPCSSVGRGVIINMVSLEGIPGLSAYSASKQGISGFSQSLDVEVGEQGVSVIPFAPGMVEIRLGCALLPPNYLPGWVSARSSSSGFLSTLPTMASCRLTMPAQPLPIWHRPGR